jgi:hypothetical protein
LRQIRQQLPWIDILTKNTGGWGHIPFSNPPIPANAAAPGAGSKPFTAGRFVPLLEASILGAQPAVLPAHTVRIGFRTQLTAFQTPRHDEAAP